MTVLENIELICNNKGYAAEEALKAGLTKIQVPYSKYKDITKLYAVQLYAISILTRFRISQFIDYSTTDIMIDCQRAIDSIFSLPEENEKKLLSVLLCKYEKNFERIQILGKSKYMMSYNDKGLSMFRRRIEHINKFLNIPRYKVLEEYDISQHIYNGRLKILIEKIYYMCEDVGISIDTLFSGKIINLYGISQISTFFSPSLQLEITKLINNYKGVSYGWTNERTNNNTR